MKNYSEELSFYSTHRDFIVLSIFLHSLYIQELILIYRIFAITILIIDSRILEAQFPIFVKSPLFNKTISSIKKISSNNQQSYWFIILLPDEVKRLKFSLSKENMNRNIERMCHTKLVTSKVAKLLKHLRV